MPMDSVLSTIISNIYMEYFEEVALESAPLKPAVWLRYVDDTFILWLHVEDIHILFKHVNKIRPSIQFTIEKEENNKLAFLNVLVTRTDNKIPTSVFRKKNAYGKLSELLLKPLQFY